MVEDLEIVTFERLLAGKELLMIFPDGVVGCYTPTAEALSESIKGCIADAVSEGQILALVPIRLTAQEFEKLQDTGSVH